MTLIKNQKATILNPGFHPNAPELKGVAAMSIESSTQIKELCNTVEW
jgi:hypothetical protein